MYFLDESDDIVLLGLSGKAGSGKDFLAKMVAWPMAFVPIPLAAHFKVDIAAKNPQYPIEQVFGTVADRTDEIRHVLQQTGTENGRMKLGENVWCRHVEAWMFHYYQYGYNRFVIPDVRFPNEVNWIQRLGGKVVRVTGRGGIKNHLGEHSSETALDGHDDLFDAFFDNDPSQDLTTKERFTALVREVCGV